MLMCTTGRHGGNEHTVHVTEWATSASKHYSIISTYVDMHISLCICTYCIYSVYKLADKLRV